MKALVRIRKQGFTLIAALVGVVVTSILLIAAFAGLAYMLQTYRGITSCCNSEYDISQAVALIERCTRESDSVAVMNNAGLNGSHAIIATFDVPDASENNKTSVVKVYRYIDSAGDRNLYVQYDNNTPVVLLKSVKSLNMQYVSGMLQYDFTLAYGIDLQKTSAVHKFSGCVASMSLSGARGKISDGNAFGDVPYSGEYVFDTTSKTITGYKGSSTTITIPSTIGGIPVEAIANDVFKGRGITGVSFPSSIKSIGDRSFYDNRLASVTFPDSVKYVGVSAFEKNNIVTVAFGSNITDIERRAFMLNGVTGTGSPKTITFAGKTMLPPRVFAGDNWNGKNK